MDSYESVLKALGERARERRVFLSLKQAELAERAGISEGTVKRFEHTGSASIENVLRIATALGADAAFASLFELPKYKSIDDALSKEQVTRRKRVRSRR